MRIYKVNAESNQFQNVYHEGRRFQTTFLLDGESRLQVWPDALELTIDDRKRPRGLFYQWSAGEFILTPEAQEDQSLISLLEVNGEFLPVSVDGQHLLLHNITCFSECVEHKRSRFKPATVAIPHQLLFPYFDVAKVPLGIHFRLREYPGARYVATDTSLAPEKDFYQWYHKQGYKGLSFRLQWDSEKPDDLICFY